MSEANEHGGREISGGKEYDELLTSCGLVHHVM